jgi:hypothetical protein
VGQRELELSLANTFDFRKPLRLFGTPHCPHRPFRPDTMRLNQMTKPKKNLPQAKDTQGHREIVP